MQPEANGDWQLQCRQVRERMTLLLASEQWADCSFLLGAGQEPARAHRVILAMSSPVFQAMFYGPVAEGDAPIPIPDIEPDVFNKLLRFVYADDVDLENYKIALDVYYAAEKYMLPHLQTLCTTYLSGNLVPQNACAIYEFANFIEDPKLEDVSLQIIKEKTKLALSPDSSFEDLTVGTVMHIFSLCDITIDSELDLLVAAERYVLARQQRYHEMADLINTPTSDFVDPENVSVNSIDKDTNLDDKIISLPSGSRQNEVEAIVETVDTATDKTRADNLMKTPNGELVTREVIKIQETSNMLLALDTEMEDDEARPEATFRFTVHNFRNLRGRVHSPPCYVRNLPWKIAVQPCQYQQWWDKWLGLYLECDSQSRPESSSWSCFAKAEFRLISHKPGTKPFCKNIQHLYCSEENDWGFSKFMAWDVVLDPESGYIQDDSITVEVHLTADAPDGIPCASLPWRDSKKHTGYTQPVQNQKNSESEVVNRARSETTFRFTVNISKMEDLDYSPVFYVRNLPWQIAVRPVNIKGQKYFRFYVRCNGDSKSFTWSCKALLDFTLISHKPNTLFSRTQGAHLFFTSTDPIRGYPYLNSWNDVMSPEKGYVKDGAITLEVHLVAEPPQGLSWHSKYCISCIDVKDVSIRAILGKIRFLTLTATELADYEPKLSLLTDQDISAILTYMVSKKNKPLPLGFSKSRIPRLPGYRYHPGATLDTVM